MILINWQKSWQNTWHLSLYQHHTHWDIIVIAHSMGVISLRITSSVRSSGQWATKLRMATEDGTVVLVRNRSAETTEHVKVNGNMFLYHTVLQLGPPGWPARWKSLLLPFLPPALFESEETRSSTVAASWGGDSAPGKILTTHENTIWWPCCQELADKLPRNWKHLGNLPRVMRAPNSSHPAWVRCRDSRLFWAAVRSRSSAILTTNYKKRTQFGF